MISERRSLLNEFIEYTSFGIISMIGVALFILADTFFIANGIGPTAIASLNVAIPVSNLLHGTGWLIGVGGSTLYSIQRGKGMEEQANAIFTFTIKLAAIVGVVLCSLLFIFNAPLLRLFGASDQTFNMAQEYFLIHVFFGTFFILSNTFISFVRNDYNPRLATISLLTGGFSNIILDYIFIYIFGWGMAGASFATILSPAITMLMLTIHLRNPRRKLHFTNYKFQLNRIFKIASIGFSSFFNEISSGIVIVIFNFTMLRMIGDIGVASYGIVANINIIAILIFQGMGQGVQPLISRYHGMVRTNEVKTLIKYSIIGLILVSTVMMTINLSFSDFIIGLFNKTNHAQIQSLANEGLFYFTTAFVVAGINIVVIFIMAAVEKSRASMILSLSRGLILIPPIILILARMFSITGVWSTMLVVESLTALFSLFFLARYIKTL